MIVHSFRNLLGGLVTEATKIELQGQLTRNINKGKSMKERLSKLKKLTSGNIVQSGSFRLCHDVCEHQIQQNKEKNENEDRGKKISTTRKLIGKIKQLKYGH